MLLAESIILLLAALVALAIYRHNTLAPGFWTNVGFIGYAVGGLYYCVYGYDEAMFLNLAKLDIDRASWFGISMAIVLVGFVFCNLGFFVAGRFWRRDLAPTMATRTVPQPLPNSVVTLAKVAALLLTLLGVVYWVYFSYRVAGGILPLFANVAAYPYLTAKAHISALPFHLVYGGVALWMLAWVGGSERRWIGLLLIPVGMVIAFSTGRIAFANAFGFSILLAYLFSTKGSASLRSFVAAVVIMLPFDVIFYFFRVYSSYLYIGKPAAFPLSAAAPANGLHHDKVYYIAKSMIGDGNVPDLQQIILVVKGLIDGKLHLEFGATYLDSFRNLAGLRIGAPDASIQSVGYRILRAYFPTKVGGPTPGMIGEAILNFGALAPVALFLLTSLATLVYVRASRSTSLLVKLVYCQFLIGAWALFLKVDSSMLLDFFWAAAPITLCWLCLQGFARLDQRYSLVPLSWQTGAVRR